MKKDCIVLTSLRKRIKKNLPYILCVIVNNIVIHNHISLAGVHTGPPPGGLFCH